MKECPVCHKQYESLSKHLKSRDESHCEYVRIQKERVYRYFVLARSIYDLLKEEDFCFSESWIFEVCCKRFGEEDTREQNRSIKRERCSLSAKKRYDRERKQNDIDFFKKYEQNLQEVLQILDEWRNAFLLSEITHKIFSQEEIIRILQEHNVYDASEARRRGMLKASKVYSAMLNKVHERWIENIQRKIQENVGIVEEIVSEWNKETPLYKIRNDLFNKEEVIWILDQQESYDKEESLRRSQKGLIVGRTNVRQQKIVISLFEEILQTEFEIEKTWRWFKRKNSRGHFSVDGYSEQYELVVEFDGYQHYTFPNVYHKTREEFEECQRRDQLKTCLLAEHDIKLLRIRENETRTKEYLIQKLLALNIEIPEQQLVA